MTFLLSILLIPLLVSLLINLYSSKDRIVKYLPIFSSLITLLIIAIYINQNDLIIKNTHQELIKLYDLFPSLNVSMSFSVTKISIALLILSNITIITSRMNV